MTLNTKTGEVIQSDAEEEVDGMLQVPSGFYGNPLGPGEIADAIDAGSEMNSHVARVVVVLYEQKHRAEETYQKAFSKAVMRVADRGPQLARHFAIAETEFEAHSLNLAKERLRYAVEMQAAVRDRVIGLMSISKRLTGGA